nr:putative zinc finger, CCHC-type [Tanacetum cinerariifolium]
RIRTARLATLKREIESLHMKEGESVDEFASKLSGFASKVRSLGYELEEVDLVKRLLDSMPKSFLQIDGFERDWGRGRGSRKSRDGNERVRDKSHVKCYKYGELGHYNNECLRWEKHEGNLIE